MGQVIQFRQADYNTLIAEDPSCARETTRRRLAVLNSGPSTAKLYDRRREEPGLDEVERVRREQSPLFHNAAGDTLMNKTSICLVATLAAIMVVSSARAGLIPITIDVPAPGYSLQAITQAGDQSGYKLSHSAGDLSSATAGSEGETASATASAMAPVPLGTPSVTASGSRDGDDGYATGSAVVQELYYFKVVGPTPTVEVDVTGTVTLNNSVFGPGPSSFAYLESAPNSGAGEQISQYGCNAPPLNVSFCTPPPKPAYQQTFTQKLPVDTVNLNNPSGSTNNTVTMEVSASASSVPQGISATSMLQSAVTIDPSVKNPGNYQILFSDQTISPPTCAQIVGNTVNPMTSTPSPSGKGTKITASFTPNYGFSLAQAASACGYAGFSWIQTVTIPPGDAGHFANNFPGGPPIVITGKSNDPPPKGGWSYELADDPSGDFSYPFYCESSDYVADGLCAETSTTLNFEDVPSDVCLPNADGTPSFSLKFNKTITGAGPRGEDIGARRLCEDMISKGSALLFSTALVGVLSDFKDGTDCLALGTCFLAPGKDDFFWSDTFNGVNSAGGISTKSDLPAEVSTGNGGITILGRVDGFNQDQATRECDEGTVALGSLFASQGDTLEAFQFAHRLLDAGSGFVERLWEKCWPELGI